MEDQIYARHGGTSSFARKRCHRASRWRAPWRHSCSPAVNRHGEVEGVQRLRVTGPAVTLTHGGRHTEITLEPGDYSIEPLAEMRGDLVQAVED